MIKGRCNCGTIRFEADRQLMGVVVCHCSICRRYSGGAGLPVVLVANDDFRWVSGEHNIQRWQKPGHDWLAAFCPTCGSPVPDQNDEDLMFIPAGLIEDGDDALEITHHIFTHSKATWDRLADTHKEHPAHFGSGAD